MMIAVVRDFLERSSSKTVEDLQRLTSRKRISVPSYIKLIETDVPQAQRQRSQDVLSNLLTPADERLIGWAWRSDHHRAPELRGEWLSPRERRTNNESTILYLHGGAYYLGASALYRGLLAKILKRTNGDCFAVDYRLAPQHPFPAAVEDALAAYLQLIDPPRDASYKPIDPKKIVIAGDSAGGGLTFALLLVLRDANLPLPAGAMTLSPWLDLTHSLPSIQTNIATDYLPAVGFKHVHSPALDYTRLPQLEPHHEEEASIGPFGEAISFPHLDEEMDRIQFYAANKALKHSLVSPLFDNKDLAGLPRILVQAGTAERLRDEAIYAALKAGNKFPGASRPSPSASVMLELYEEQPHVFQMLLPTRMAAQAFDRLGQFVLDATQTSHDPSTFSIRTITADGTVKDTTDEMVEHTSKQWDTWEARLKRTSLKERLAESTATYKQYLESRLSR
ncbi:hypothetical protein DFQ28_009475 [Apophysomyces sp. BC1034]|nr:hypothetical protein DFQ29_004540 [Apophysomyces sp. BC1021]KAG0185371.1 hypothetical protein DFQ28_009475 [Apophysomyces sp. BC1034]